MTKIDEEALEAALAVAYERNELWAKTNGSPTDVATKAIITAYLSALSSKADGARSVIADALIRNRGLTILHQNTPDLSDETKEIAQEIEDDARTDAEAILTALSEEGYVIVPRELDPKNMDHWKVASAGIRAIEEFGGELGSDHTPERQISDAYRDMIRAMISKAEQGEG